MSRPHARIVSAGVALLAVTACGSTVPLSQQVAGGGLSSETLSGDGVQGVPKSGVQTGGGLTTSTGGTVNTSTGQQLGGSTQTSTTRTAVPSPGLVRGKDGPGITRTTLTLGLAYATNSDAAQAALGNTAVTSADIGAIMRILVDDTNAHGGMAGRRILPIYHPVSSTSGQTQSQVSEAECADFTQDHKVFAVLPGGDDSFLACLHKYGGVAGMGGNIVGSTTAQYDTYPENFDVSAISVDRLSHHLAPVLKRSGYFSPWNTTSGQPGTGTATVGIIVPDLPRFHRGVEVLVEELRRVGVKVAPENIAYFYWPKSAGENGQAVSDIQNYVLKFRSGGVTHVIPFEQNALAFFGSGADKQQYRPRYGVNSATGAQAYNGSLLPASQLNGAVGLGFFPSLDLSQEDNPDDGPYSSDTRRKCLTLLRKHGQTFTSTNAQAGGLLLCDLFWTLRDVLNNVPKDQPMNQEAVAASLDSIGALPSATLTTLGYGPHQRDPVSGGWVWGFNNECSCFRYTGQRFSLA